MKKNIFTGSATALITPFYDQKIDFDSLGRIIDIQLESETDALVISGTTGESATLSEEEKKALFAFAAERVGGKIPVIAGTGTNDTALSLRLSRTAEQVGCDALLVVTPYYNKPSPNGLYEHYSRVADSTSLPLIAYNVPSRTGVNIPVSVVERLSASGAIAALKEASGDLSRIASIISACPDLTVYSGNDDQILPIMSLGGQGVISVLSNILPKETHRMCAECLDGNFGSAKKLQLHYLKLIGLLFSEVNPIPVKYIMSKLGLCRPEYRLPITDPTESTRQLLDKAIIDYGLR